MSNDIDKFSLRQLYAWQSWWFELYQNPPRYMPNETPPFTLDEITDEIEYRKNHGGL